MSTTRRLEWSKVLTIDLPDNWDDLPVRPHIELERAIASSSGFSLIAGIDEAGRGAIAGPVFAAAVILPLNDEEKLERLFEVDDSKRLEPAKREELYDLIIETAVSFGIGSASETVIDSEGIIAANAKAMTSAVRQLSPLPQFLLVDGRMKLKQPSLPQQSIIKGDAISLSIAAASILAKVSRDRLMISLSQRFPNYGLERNKGYCTSEHVAALADHGPTTVHRQSFAPVRLGLF